MSTPPSPAMHPEPARPAAGGPGALPALSPADTARLVGGALGPIGAQGVIARRPRVVAAAGKAGTDDRSVRLLQELRDRYGDGPVRVPLPGRPAALVLDADGVRRVLTEGPEPFAPASWEKRGALRQFQPHGVLISHGDARAERRRFTESVLDTGSPLHADASHIAAVARAETAALRDGATRTGALGWDGFVTTWWRIVRRIVLGDGARDDHDLTDLLTRLRRRGTGRSWLRAATICSSASPPGCAGTWTGPRRAASPRGSPGPRTRTARSPRRTRSATGCSRGIRARR
ncbi:hypothetical protein [Pseudonocardia parietis]|uniref:Cytochrome P450 n=1 Tax=Pseudonocardia parietis TaxID=570936 RepID=A0ABS4VRJ1_9PSEU|nr:hypothetical protein [Pseudonocardia parietis]MBP2366540.1 hypothetical protein [Pseudonocardia parietis]